MKKILVSLFVIGTVSVSAATYNPSSRIQTVGENLLTQNGIPATNVKFMTVSTTADNSNYAESKVVNISTDDLTYAGNDNEVAAVIANELGHIISGHASKGKVVSLLQTATNTNITTSNQTATSLVQNYKLSKEDKEADVLSVNLMANAGYNPLAIIVVLTKQAGTYRETIQGKPANADRAMNVYDYANYAYPAKVKSGYGCNEYKNFLTYAETIIASRKENQKLQTKVDKEMKNYRKNSVSQITKFKTRGGISGWDAAYELLNGTK